MPRRLKFCRHKALKTIQLKSLAFSLQVQELELENERIKRDIERKTEQKRIVRHHIVQTFRNMFINRCIKGTLYLSEAH
jgi:hypothetical protein